MDSWLPPILTSVFFLFIIGACTGRYLFVSDRNRTLDEDPIDDRKRTKEAMSKKGKSSKGGSTSAKKSTFEVSAVESLFDSICEEDDKELATMEGIMKLGELIGIDASTDIRMLVMLWKFGAITKAGCITRSEFLSGMEKSYITDVASLKESLYTFDAGFLETSGEQLFYLCYLLFRSLRPQI